MRMRDKTTTKQEKRRKWAKNSGGKEFYLYPNKSTMVDETLTRY